MLLPECLDTIPPSVCLMKDTLFLSTIHQKKQWGNLAYTVNNQQGCTSSTPHCFNGKEKDYESGFHYYGARYYWSEVLTGWLSVDPLADKYPDVSPYAYCMWNPVRLVDPNGCMIDDYFSFDGRYLGSDNAETHNVRIIRESTWEYLGRDEDGIVEHVDGNHASCSFSEASKHGMSLDAQLAVYQHYNITGFVVHALPKEREDSKIGGMQTAVDYVAGKTTITLNVKLFGNMNIQLCDNSCNIINSYVHENDHIAKAKEWGYQKYRTYKEEMLSSLETSAIAVQKEHPSWQCTSEKYKIRIEAYNESFH